MNEKVKELARNVVETVGDMKLSEFQDNIEGRMLKDFFYVAKSITNAKELNQCKCSSAAMDSTACDKKPAKKKASSKK